MERETGIEPATNSLEGYDSTTELLPLTFVFNNFNCRLLHRLCANGAERRHFAQSLHKADVPLHKCTKSAPGIAMHPLWSLHFARPASLNYHGFIRLRVHLLHVDTASDLSLGV